MQILSHGLLACGGKTGEDVLHRAGHQRVGIIAETVEAWHQLVELGFELFTSCVQQSVGGEGSTTSTVPERVLRAHVQKVKGHLRSADVQCHRHQFAVGLRRRVALARRRGRRRRRVLDTRGGCRRRRSCTLIHHLRVAGHLEGARAAGERIDQLLDQRGALCGVTALEEEDHAARSHLLQHVAGITQRASKHLLERGGMRPHRRMRTAMLHHAQQPDPGGETFVGTVAERVPLRDRAQYRIHRCFGSCLPLARRCLRLSLNLNLRLGLSFVATLCATLPRTAHGIACRSALPAGAHDRERLAHREVHLLTFAARRLLTEAGEHARTQLAVVRITQTEQSQRTSHLLDERIVSAAAAALLRAAVQTPVLAAQLRQEGGERLPGQRSGERSPHSHHAERQRRGGTQIHVRVCRQRAYHVREAGEAQRRERICSTTGEQVASAEDGAVVSLMHVLALQVGVPLLHLGGELLEECAEDRRRQVGCEQAE
mmetsp:Transcript_7627/g.23464  ORF Transcript_7627/g.23464 Transcript_7627/m.23464 type:complete len:486 (-) Transcript_7627:1856-3313(-)